MYCMHYLCTVYKVCTARTSSAWELHCVPLDLSENTLRRKLQLTGLHAQWDLWAV